MSDHNFEILAGFCCLVVFALIIIGIIVFLNARKAAFIAEQKAKAQEKCKEFINVACSLNTFPTTTVSSSKIVSSIVHGNRVSEGVFPHQALVKYYLSNNPSKWIECGGTLISERFILTAAHCANDTNDGVTKVLLGSPDKESVNNGQWKNVRKVHIHPDYRTNPDLADVSLLELEENVKFKSNVRPICLNTKFEKYYNSMIVSGWGQTESGNGSKYLNMVELRIDKNVEESCRSLLKDHYDTMTETLICAVHSTKGIHDGDSGGPLQVELKSNCSNTWEQIGIVVSSTMGNYTGVGQTKQFFAKVEFFVPWIVSVVWPD